MDQQLPPTDTLSRFFQGPARLRPYHYDQDTCPCCGVKNHIHKAMAETTCAGWFPPGPENNPNRHTLEVSCGACGLTYTRNWIPLGRLAWVVVDGPLKHAGYMVAGNAGPHTKGYLYPCPCGEWIHNHQWKKTVSYERVGDITFAYPEDLWDCPKCGLVSRTPPTPSDKT